MVSGRLTPLRSDNLPPTSTRVSRSCRVSTSMAVRRILPSSSSSVWPGSIAAKISGCGRWTRVASPGAGSASSVNVCAFRQHDRAAGESADPQLRTLQIDQDADRPAVLVLDRADRRDQLAHPLVRACGSY